MNLRPALLTAALLLSANAFANNPALSKDEFDQMIAQPFKATNGKSGLIVEIHLKPDNSAVARKGYNDIGTWRIVPRSDGVAVIVAPMYECSGQIVWGGAVVLALPPVPAIAGEGGAP